MSKGAAEHADLIHRNLLGAGAIGPEIETEVLVKSESFNYSLLRVPRGAQIDFHTSTGSIGIQVVQGSGVLKLDDRMIRLEQGSFVFIPAHVTQGLTASEDLTVVHMLTH